MSFSDDELKRFREHYDELPVERIEALLARLEAAERYARDMAAEYPDRFPQEYKAWRKASGK